MMGNKDYLSRGSDMVCCADLLGKLSFAPEFQCCYFYESSCLFYLSFNFDFYVSKIMHL